MGELQIDEQRRIEARDAVKSATVKEPLLAGRRSKVLEAVAYFIISHRDGVRMSMYDAEELFGVADTPFRKCFKLMAPVMAFSLKSYRRKRSRNAYDIYAELLHDEGENLTGYIRKVHLKYSELKKHLDLLTERGLIATNGDQRKKGFVVTERGKEYLEAYHRLASVLGNPGE